MTEMSSAERPPDSGAGEAARAGSKVAIIGSGGHHHDGWVWRSKQAADEFVELPVIVYCEGFSGDCHLVLLVRAAVPRSKPCLQLAALPGTVTFTATASVLGINMHETD
jgi:hypothetical protein